MRDQLSQSKWTRRVLLSLAILPFAIAIFAHGTGSRVQTSLVGKPKPALAFETYLVDTGLVKETARTVGARFRFKNLSDHTVTVKELIPQLWLPEPTIEKKGLPPQRSRRVSAQNGNCWRIPRPKRIFC